MSNAFRIAQGTDVTALVGCPIVFYDDTGSLEHNILNTFQFPEFLICNFGKRHWVIKLKLSRENCLNLNPSIRNRFSRQGVQLTK